MSDVKNDTNSGVEATTGFTFQKHCAIYLLLENYDVLIGNNFFICIEHHDDVLFAHLNSSSEIQKIEAYQAKKSSSEWSIGEKLSEIIAKMTLVGRDLENDPHQKSIDYSQKLTFLTNKSIKLHCGNRKKGTPKYSEIIRENNVLVCYSKLHNKIKENLSKKIEEKTYAANQLDNLAFRYIDVANTAKSQREQIVGMLTGMFKDKISDPDAAVSVLIKLFSEVETTYNQGNECKLLDISKRIYSSEIFNTLDVICSKAKAYKLWRDNARELSEKLKIPINKSRDYKEYLNNCFDYLKDLEQVEFQKIYHFVDKNRDIDETSYSDVECIEKLHSRFLNKNQSQLEQNLISFAIVAAYIETRDKR